MESSSLEEKTASLWAGISVEMMMEENRPQNSLYHSHGAYHLLLSSHHVHLSLLNTNIIYYPVDIVIHRIEMWR